MDAANDAATDAAVTAATNAVLTVAVDALRAGHVVAIPTETVYGLAADAADADAVRRIYDLKGRPADHPVIVHVASVDDVARWAAGVPDAVGRLAAAFWPGPLTVVLRRDPSVPDEVTGGRDTVAIRVPDHPLTLALLRAFDGGLAAPSANRFGRVSPTTAADVRAEFSDEIAEGIVTVLDGGPCTVGVESTIVDLTGRVAEVLRPGAVTVEQLAVALDAPVRGRATGPARAPGMLAAHYAPKAWVDLADSGVVAAGMCDAPADALRVAVLALRSEFAGVRFPDHVLVLDAGDDAAEYAHRLYGLLRRADAERCDVIVAVPPPETGIGVAVADRLRRAASSR
jgi:L-threonylcarbamoyladenylate synthase